MPLRVLHLVGSAVSEFYADLSRLYASDCLTATADPQRYEPLVAYVSPDRRWRFFEAVSPANLDPDSIAAAEPLDVAGAIARIDALRIDVMVPQMFCLPGMTHYRALFDVLGIPYVGNRPDVMAIAADKARARAIVAAAGVRVPEGEVLRRGDVPTLVPPTVIKPVDTDNSLGLALVRQATDYERAIKDAFTHADAVLVERYVELGREVRCGVVERGGELVALPLEEYDVDTDRKPIRDHADKIDRSGDGELNLVAKDAAHAWMVDVDDPITERVWAAAKLAHVALGCRHYSLFDFRIDPDGEPWFLEAGLYCSFAKQSVVSMMAAAAGIDLPELFGAAVDQALTGS
ncbi:D-alanine--D-alanine ligase [uncultured Jatrophihabitans sp.]|uniref:D-alanine--D-alanine ligase family protein n=1 Tax=uncultured Jatrophihabitans sp. TaxID=1610747 RepID=UPI0035C9D9CA